MLSPLKSAAAITFAALTFMSAAIWNGSPIFFYDSADYLQLPFTWDLPVYRTMPYGVFVGIGRLAGTLWAVVAAQAFITAYVLHEALAVFVAERASKVLAFLALPLAVLSGLPWVVGQIMPDALTGPFVLAVIALTFAHNRLGRFRQIVLSVLLAVSASLHSSHIAVGVGLLIVIVSAKWLFGRHMADLRPRPLMPALALAAGVVLVASIHWITIGRPFVTQPPGVLWLARLVEDGIAQRFLDDNCRRGDEYKLCKWSGKLPSTANTFLWFDGGAPYHIYGSWEKMRPEARKIVEKTLRDYPLLHVSAAARLTAKQLIRFRTGDSLERKMGWILDEPLKKYFPGDFLNWKASRQARAGGIDVNTVNAVHVPAMALAQLLLVGLAIVAYRRRERMTFTFSVLAIVALLGNAVVCGALSNPNDRYQSRLVWIALVAIAIGAQRLRNQARTETNSSE